jgi:hypothetical protein
MNLTLLALLAFPRHPRPPAPGEVVALWRRELGLNDEQVKAFERIIGAHRAATRPLQMRQMNLRREFVLAAASLPPDTALLNRMTAESAELHRQLDQGLASHYRALLGVCTPDQRRRMAGIFFETLKPPPGMRK